VASSVRAEPGKLEVACKLQQTVLSSVQIKLAWDNRERQVAEMLSEGVRQDQARVMALSNYLVRTQDEVRETISASYWRRQAALDRIHANFSRYIRSVDVYQAPGGGRVELPSGYRNAWVNGSGEYIVTNDSFFNPNQRLRRSWQRLTPAR
jgi:hypothetical protein